MRTTPFSLKIAPLAAAMAFLATWQVHSRSGNEVFRCETGQCELGSGASWFLTGVTLASPFIAALGFAWSRHLHRRGRLGPFEQRWLPDGEEIFEILAVLAAGLITYWLLRNGPSIEAVSVGRPNTWLIEAREWRDDQSSTDLVPARRTWFAVGVALSAPFAFSFGSMTGREWYGRMRRRAQRAEDNDEVIDLTELEKATVIDLTDSNAELPLDDR